MDNVMSMKGILDVPRDCVPCITEIAGCNPYCPLDSSFPSGHAATAFAGFTAIWIFKGMKPRPPASVALFILPVLVALSRIMLGVHTLTDVIAGAIIGILVVILVSEIDKRV